MSTYKEGQSAPDQPSFFSSSIINSLTNPSISPGDNSPRTDIASSKPATINSHAPAASPSHPTPSPLSPSAAVVREQTDPPNLPPHLRDTITRVPVTPGLSPYQENTPSKKRQKTSSATVMEATQETMAAIREKNPDLALSGNVISVTFNIPHSLEYRKGADWVSAIASHIRACIASWGDWRTLFLHSLLTPNRS